jgi:UDP-N-acetylglucosamine 4-epimerase
MMGGRPCVINGDGQTSRDFCYIENVVLANLLAALTQDSRAVGQVYNVAAGQRTTLLELHELLASALRERRPGLVVSSPAFADFRAGDVRHSLADISKARTLLGYEPMHDVRAGLREAVGWYVDHLAT